MIQKYTLIWYYFILAALALLLPLHAKAVPPAIILLTLLSLPLFSLKALQSKFVLSFLAFYALYLLGLTYTNDLDTGLFDLEVKLAILIFPISLLPVTNLSKTQLDRVYEFFIIGCLVSIFICFNIAFWNYTYERWAIKQLLYHENLGINFFLSSRVSYFMHPSYFSMYLGFAAAVLLYRPSGFFKNIFLRYGVVFVFAVAILFLASKIGILALVLLFGYFIFSLKNKKLLITVLALMIGVFTGLLTFSTEFANKFKNLTAAVQTSKINETSDESSAARVLIWGSTVSLIKESPLIGYGTGDVKQALNSKYKENGYLGVLDHELNAHNQFLQSSLALGLLGFAALALIFFFAFRKFVSSKSILGKLLVLILLINFMVESMLETQAGVVFFAFWLLFEYYQSSSENLNSNKVS
jgi:O-antigen ligase